MDVIYIRPAKYVKPITFQCIHPEVHSTLNECKSDAIEWPLICVIQFTLMFREENPSLIFLSLQILFQIQVEC